MELEKAIEILSHNGLQPKGTTWGEYLQAVMLGKEALLEKLERERGEQK